MPKPWQKMPVHTFADRVTKKKEQEVAKKALSDFNTLLEHEKMLGVVSYRDRIAQKTEEKVERKPLFNLKGSAAPQFSQRTAPSSQ